MRVCCVRTSNAFGERVTVSEWLEIGATYDVLEVVIEASRIYLRIQGKEETPALFDMNDFDVVDGRIPRNWTVVEHDSGFLSFTPAAWGTGDFWSRYFNGEPDAKEIFERERAAIVTPDSG